MKKHLLFFTFVIALIAVLSACGGKKDDTSAAMATPAATATPAASATPAATAAATAAGSDQPQEVKLIASAVTFKYDQTDYHVKKGVPVKLTLEMKDGNHGAKLADFNIDLKKDNPTATFTPEKAGTFLIKCSVPCGNGHMTMTANLIVE